MDLPTTPAPGEALLTAVTEAALAHGEQCLGLGRADAAVGAFGLAIVLARTSVDVGAPATLAAALGARARAWEATGMTARALDDYVAALSLAPDDPAILAAYQRLGGSRRAPGRAPRTRKPSAPGTPPHQIES